MRMHGIPVAVLFALAIQLLTVPPAASSSEGSVQAARSRSLLVPIPMVSLNPTTGYNAGMLVAWVRVGSGFTESIMAPSASYHESYGTLLTMRHFQFTKRDDVFRLYASYGAMNYHESYLDFRVPRFYRGRLGARGRLFAMRDPAFRFYGYGSDTRDENKAFYAFIDRGGYGTLAVWLSRFLQVGLDVSAHDGRIAPTHIGGVDRYIRNKYSGVDGLSGGFVFQEGVTLQYDSRDSPSVPRHGAFASASVRASSRALGSLSNFHGFGVDMRSYVSAKAERFTTVPRLFLDRVSGDDDTPLFERPALGGKWTFRGYGFNRFTDWARLGIAVEQRALLATPDLFGIRVGLEPALFVSTGRVASTARHLARLSGFAWVAGGAWRFIVTDSLVASIDLGFSREGPAAHVSIEYPF